MQSTSSQQTVFPDVRLADPKPDRGKADTVGINVPRDHVLVLVLQTSTAVPDGAEPVGPMYRDKLIPVSLERIISVIDPGDTSEYCVALSVENGWLATVCP